MRTPLAQVDIFKMKNIIVTAIEITKIKTLNNSLNIFDHIFFSI